ncbi:hypothetical protein KJ693_07415 [bacterium]|nr:hypothetical protein [bacterium]MBU1615126.1 hypothetical protein [bacterium]
MINVKEAAQKAAQYLKSLVLDATDIMLEEVELTDDEQSWLITLSYTASSASTGSSVAADIQNIFGFGKTAKVFKIKSDNGKVMSMKIRKV